MLDSKSMNIFARKEEARHTDATPERSKVLEIAGTPARSVAVNQPVPLTMKPSVVGETSTPSPPSGSHITEGFELTGDMTSGGSLTVDGTIHGNLIVKTLMVRASGVVDGSVKADRVSVEGTLAGAVECRDLVIGNRAVVDGKLRYDTLTIARGGTIKGELKRAQ